MLLSTLCFKNVNQLEQWRPHFLERCPVHIKYMVFTVKPHYSALVMSCRLPSLKERWPLTSSLQVKSSTERTAQAFCAPLPQLRFTKGHLVSVQDLFENYWKYWDEQGQCFSKTKSLMTYFTVELRFCLELFCVLLGGTSNTVR